MHSVLLTNHEKKLESQVGEKQQKNFKFEKIF